VEDRKRFRQASVLLVTSDRELQNEVQRVAAGVAVPVSVVPEPREALASWHAASIVLVGGDCAIPMSRLRPAPRSGVSVVHAGLASSDVFRSAFDLGATTVLELPTSQDWLVEALAQSGTANNAEGKVVGFLSAAGGSGASSLATATACLGADLTGTALVDLDPGGVGIERLLGYEEASVTTWGTLGGQPLGPQAFRDSLPKHGGVHLVGFGSSSPRPVESSAAAAVLAACPRVFGLTVLDIPRSLGGAEHAAVERCDVVVIVCPQSVGAALAGHRVLARLGRTDHVMAVTRAGPRTLDPVSVADTLQVPLLSEVPDQRDLDEALACGMEPLRSRGSGLRRAALTVLARLDLGT
jgi:secretion/DNA translocation related CpaE-like protein